MTHKTKGIVLRTIKYGETSIVVTIFTRQFGIQAYLLNGIRTQKKHGNRAALFQPAAILDMEAYHNELKNLQRIKEYNWAVVYRNILADVFKNSIALYIVELLQRMLKQPEEHPELFDFCEDALMQLDLSDNTTAANFPLFFTVHLPQFFGFKMTNNYSEKNRFADLLEGNFSVDHPTHPAFLEEPLSGITSELLKMMQPGELNQIKLNRDMRRSLLLKYQDYYRLHIPEFGQLKTLEILHEVLG